MMNLGIYKMQQVLVYTPSGSFLGAWYDAPLLAGFKETINSATTPIRVVLPRSFSNFDQAGAPNSLGTVAQGNIVKYFLYGPNLPANGLLRFQGVIDGYEPQIAANGEETVVVTLTPFDSVLGDHGVVSTLNLGTPGTSSTYMDPVAMFNYFFTHNDTVSGIQYMAPFTLDPTNPTTSGNSGAYTVSNQTMADIFNTIVTLLPANWFYRMNPNKTMTINVAPTTAQHILYVGQNISNPLYKQEWLNLKNVVVLKGGTQVGTTHPVYVNLQGSDVSTFGERMKLVNESRLTDVSTANLYAQGILNVLDRVTFRATLRIPDFRGSQNTGGSTGLGYDIETIRVGDTLQILDPVSEQIQTGRAALWDQAKWDVGQYDSYSGSPLSQVVQVLSLSYAFDYIDVEVGALQPSQDRQLYRVMSQLQSFTLI